jgi:biotin carboxyl carrier protein
MRLTAELNSETYQVAVQDEGGQVIAEVDGRRYKFTVHTVEEQVYLFLNDNRVFECRVESKLSERESLFVQVGNAQFNVGLVDPRRLRGSIKGQASKDRGSAEISSPMAGKIVRVLVEHDAEVKAGDGIVVVEAMKMQNELKCPCDGIVARLRVEVGATVNAGEVLAVIEAKKD